MIGFEPIFIFIAFGLGAVVGVGRLLLHWAD